MSGARTQIRWIGAVAAVGAVALLAVGIRHERTPAPVAPITQPGVVPGAQAVSGGGFTLVSTAITLPADDTHFPAAAGSDLLEANCTACHSASMVLTQPPLKPEQWQATVTKMREVYKAPIAERDVPALVGALSTPGMRGGAATGR